MRHRSKLMAKSWQSKEAEDRVSQSKAGLEGSMRRTSASVKPTKPAEEAEVTSPVKKQGLLTQMFKFG